jgi:hypothetical protein
MIAVNSMERRLALRSPTDVPLTAYRDGIAFSCRAIDLSCGGALVYDPSRRRPPLVQRLELAIGEREIRTLARTIWCAGKLRAVRFIGLDEVDRLDIAEHIDARDRRVA